MLAFILAIPLPAITLIWLHRDHELLFGCFTLSMALAGVALFADVLLRRRVEDQAGSTFLWLAAVSVSLLAFVAHDWARRQLVIAALIVAAALSMFIIRVGYESLKVPPRWERIQVADRAQADEQALKTQFKGEESDHFNAFTAARTTLTGILTARPAPDIDKQLSGAADRILSHATQQTKKVTSVDSEDFDAFDKLLGNEAAASAPAVTANLADAVHALRTAESAAAGPIDSTLLDRAIRNVGRQDADAITTNREWVSDKHELDIQLATFRAAVTGTDADQAALKAVLARQPDVDDDISILAAIENGPETLWRSASHSTGPALVPGPLGWVIVGALLLGLLAWLLKINARQLAGPVNVMPKDPDDGSGQSTDDKLVTVLRVAVLQNVDEPGAAPGSPSANPVTTLLDIAGGPLSTVSKLVQAVLTVTGRRYGYQVTMDVTTSDPGPPSSPAKSATSSITILRVSGGRYSYELSRGAEESDEASGTPPEPGPAAKNTPAPTPSASTTVLIRVMSIASGVTLATHLCTMSDDETAVRTAGLWAAGYILNRSSRIPGWAAWHAETAQALALTKNSSAQDIDTLIDALKEAPDSGILLVLLGHHYELAGQTENAISYYARALAAYPRYVVARYRLAAVLAMMSHTKNWYDKEKVDRAKILRGVKAALTALKVGKNGAEQKLLEELLAEKAAGQDAAANFRKLARLLLEDLEADTWRLFRLVGALRRSERASIWPSLKPGSTHPAARFHWLVKSARLALAGQLDKLDEEARQPDSWWQISYNAACAYASKDPPDPDKAFEFLEKALVSPGIHQLSSDWVNIDPDLKPLENDRRFKWFAEQLR